MTITPRNNRLRKDIGVCLEVTDALIPYLAPDNDIPRELDKDVRHSAEATFHNATTKLDELISGLGKYDIEKKFESKLLAGANADISARKEAALTSKYLRRPSVLYRPEIGHTTTGAWCAYYGDISRPESCIIGVGDTVENAMLDFDNDWRTKRSQATQNPPPNTLKKRKKS